MECYDTHRKGGTCPGLGHGQRAPEEVAGLAEALVDAHSSRALICWGDGEELAGAQT